MTADEFRRRWALEHAQPPPVTRCPPGEAEGARLLHASAKHWRRTRRDWLSSPQIDRYAPRSVNSRAL